MVGCQLKDNKDNKDNKDINIGAPISIFLNTGHFYRRRGAVDTEDNQLKITFSGECHDLLFRHLWNIHNKFF